MIPTNTRIHRPVAESNLILYIYGLLKVRAVARKGEGQGSARIELRVIGDEKTEILMQKRVVRFHSCLDFLPAMADGNAGFEISLIELIVLKDLDGC